MKTLHLLRHAKSCWAEPGLGDHGRPLSRRGESAAARLGVHIARAGIRADRIVCSTARRAVDTLAAVREALPASAAFVYEDAIYEAPAATLLEVVKDLPDADGTVMLVGHNPGLEGLARCLVGDGDASALARLAEKYPTGALATIELAVDSWRSAGAGTGRLIAFVTPRMLE